MQVWKNAVEDVRQTTIDARRIGGTVQRHYSTGMTIKAIEAKSSEHRALGRFELKDFL
jgi:hypothetical protein